MEKQNLADCHCAWVLCWEAINHSSVCDFIKKKPSVFDHRASTIKLCTLYAGLQWFQKLTQPDDSTVYYTYRTHKKKKTTLKNHQGKKYLTTIRVFVVITTYRITDRRTRLPLMNNKKIRYRKKKTTSQYQDDRGDPAKTTTDSSKPSSTHYLFAG